MNMKVIKKGKEEDQVDTTVEQKMPRSICQTCMLKLQTPRDSFLSFFFSFPSLFDPLLALSDFSCPFVVGVDFGMPSL